MKKILFLLTASLLTSAVLADVDFSEAIKNSSMPSDSEIRAVISQFNFPKDQQEAIFKDTKNRLREIYSGRNMDKTNKELNQYLNELESGEVDAYFNSSKKGALLQELSTFPQK